MDIKKRWGDHQDICWDIGSRCWTGKTLFEKTPADTKHCYWEPILEEETTSELLWPESLGILSHLKSSWLICKNCKIPVPEFENPLIFPFHIHFWVMVSGRLHFQKFPRKYSPLWQLSNQNIQKWQNNFRLLPVVTYSMNKIVALACRGARWQKFGNNCQNKCFHQIQPRFIATRERFRSKARVLLDIWQSFLWYKNNYFVFTLKFSK